MGPATTCPNPGRTRAETRLLPPLVPSDGYIVVQIADRGTAVKVAHTVAVGDSPVGRTGAGTAVDIAEVVETAVDTAVDIVEAAEAAVKPGIEVVVVVAEDMLGIAVVGDASVAAGTVQRKAGGPKKQCMWPGESVVPLVDEGPRRNPVGVRVVAARVIYPAEW